MTCPRYSYEVAKFNFFPPKVISLAILVFLVKVHDQGFTSSILNVVLTSVDVTLCQVMFAALWKEQTEVNHLRISGD